MRLGTSITNASAYVHSMRLRTNDMHFPNLACSNNNLLCYTKKGAGVGDSGACMHE